MEYLGIIMGFGIGIIIFAFLLCITVYVLSSLAYMKALKMMDYDKPWMAWIPYGCYYALAECSNESHVEILPNMIIPMSVYKFWWIIPLVLTFVNIPYIGGLIDLAVRVICLGWSFHQIYRRLGDDNDNKVLSYLSGWLPIIAVVRFMTIKEE